MTDRCSIAIIGAGLAGVALAARLAACGRTVWLFEEAPHSPRHARRGAVLPWDPSWQADDDSAQLSSAGAALWEEAPRAFSPKAMLHVFSGGGLDRAGSMWARGLRAATGVEQIEPADLAKRLPRWEASRWDCEAALWAPAGAAGTINLQRLYSHFRSELYRHGGRIMLNEPVLDTRYGGGAWTIRTGRRTVRADMVANCAGAWADEVAKRCDVRPLRLRIEKRAALHAALAEGADSPWRNYPFLVWHKARSSAFCEIQSNGWALISPAETADGTAGDVKAAPAQIAAAIDWFEWATGLRLDETKSASWAWAYATTRDSRPVIGWAREAPAYFWFTAWGGVGPECLLSSSAIAADMMTNRSDFDWLVDQYGIRMNRFAPDRLPFAGVMA